MRSRKRSAWRSITLATRVMSIRSEPMPMIMIGSASLAHALAPAVHGRAHGANGLAQAHEQRLPHHEVTDVQFGDPRQSRDRLGGVIVEAMAGMNLEPRGARQRHTLHNALPLRLGLGGMAVDHGVAPATGMDFDHGRTESGG